MDPAPRTDNADMPVDEGPSRSTRLPVVASASASGEWQQNAPPIHRLSVEILAMIFVELISSGDRVGRISLVCRLWRDVVLQTVALWQYIYVPSKIEWLALSLQRSRGTLVDVYLWRPIQQLALAIPLLLPAVDRLRSLILQEVEDETLDLLEASIFAVECLPQLEEFRATLVLDSDEIATEPRLFSLNDASRFPALRVLDVEGGLYPPLTSPIFAQLRCIRMTDTSLEPRISVTQFLLFLDACKQLEEFDCLAVSFIDLSDQSPDRYPTTDIVVSLPRLRMFRWTWPGTWYAPPESDLRELLRHIHFPASAEIELRLDIPPSLQSVEEGFIFLDYFNTVPEDPACLPILRTATVARLDRYMEAADGVPIFCQLSPDPSAGSLLLIYDCSDPPPEDEEDSEYFPYTRTEQLRDFRDLFARAPLTELVLPIQDIDAESFVDVFGTFPLLHTLQACECATSRTRAGGIKHLFQALTAKHVDSDDNVEEEGEMDTHSDLPRPRAALPASTVVLPALRIVRLDELAWTWHMPYVLFSCFALRAKRGAPLLSELALYVYFPGRSVDWDRDMSREPALVLLDAIAERTQVGNRERVIKPDAYELDNQ
ncbi:hypothetical protein C8Q77DRAFT_1073725 [Trametes polyzona]|nr:hypothetical protein C8Q77DRAFT_1073725 [Trametes polyzona]